MKFGLIAAQSGESLRRVRAQLEQRDLMDVLRNQIIERKVIDLVLSHAKFKDVPFEPEGPTSKPSTGRPAAARTIEGNSRSQAWRRGRTAARNGTARVE